MCSDFARRPTGRWLQKWQSYLFMDDSHRLSGRRYHNKSVAWRGACSVREPAQTHMPPRHDNFDVGVFPIGQQALMTLSSRGQVGDEYIWTSHTLVRCSAVGLTVASRMKLAMHRLDGLVQYKYLTATCSAFGWKPGGHASIAPLYRTVLGPRLWHSPDPSSTL